MSRPEMIKELEQSGICYNWDKYKDTQIFKIWEKLKRLAKH